MAKSNKNETFWEQMNEALGGLDPAVVLRDADRPISLALIADRPSVLHRMEEFVAPKLLSPRKAEQVHERLASFLLPLDGVVEEGLREIDIVICSPGAASEIALSLPDAYVFYPDDPGSLVANVLNEHWDLALPLAKNFLPFRRVIQRRWMRSIALQNALFAMLTAAPEAMPSLFSWRALAGLASSTVFITSNQLRLAWPQMIRRWDTASRRGRLRP